jgi:hypothetical protein
MPPLVPFSAVRRIPRFFVPVLFFFGLPFLAAPAPGAFMPTGTLKEAADVSREDGVGRGWCGRGVWSVLTTLGYGEGIRSANGQDWETVLYNAGWAPLRCPDPSMAPFGSVLVYLSDMRLQGRNVVGTKGGIYGHVELVGIDQGKRAYISDTPRRNPGGSVPHNFTRRAWVPPGYVQQPSFPPGSPKHPSPSPNPSRMLVRSSYDPSAIARSAKELLDERLSLAEVVFSSRSL